MDIDLDDEEIRQEIYKKIVRFSIENGFSNLVPYKEGTWDKWEKLLEISEQQIRHRYPLNVAEKKLLELYSMVLKVAPVSNKSSYAKRSLWHLLLSLQRDPLDDVLLWIRLVSVNHKIAALKIACAHYYRLAGMPVDEIVKFLGTMSGTEIDEAIHRIKANESVTDLCEYFLYPQLSTNFKKLLSQVDSEMKMSSLVDMETMAVDVPDEKKTEMKPPLAVIDRVQTPQSGSYSKSFCASDVKAAPIGYSTTFNIDMPPPTPAREKSLLNSAFHPSLDPLFQSFNNNCSMNTSKGGVPGDRMAPLTYPKYVSSKPSDSNASYHTVSHSSHISEQRSFRQPMTQPCLPIYDNLPSCNVTANERSHHVSSQRIPSADTSLSTSRTQRSILSSSVVHHSSSLVLPVKNAGINSGTNVAIINGQKYIFLRQLGMGGTSQVYAALEDSENVTEVAIKCIPLSGMSNEVVSMYQSEIESLLKFRNSRNVIHILNHEIRPDYIFIVLERGSIDLSEILREGPLALETVIFYWKQMLQCVSEIHSHRIIHLDLKPNNFVFVGHRLKLIDLGISRRLVDDRSKITLDTPQGTVNYMSPEQLPIINMDSPSSKDQSKVHVTCKSDIWSLGVILYVMVTGHTPWNKISNNVILRIVAILTHAIEFPTSPLTSIMKLCLNRDSTKRPNAEELLSIDYFDIGNCSSLSFSVIPDDATLS